MDLIWIKVQVFTNFKKNLTKQLQGNYRILNTDCRIIEPILRVSKYFAIRLPLIRLLQCTRCRRCHILSRSEIKVVGINAIKTYSQSFPLHTFINSTLDSRGLSNRNSNRKFSSIGSSWANWKWQFALIFFISNKCSSDNVTLTSLISIFPSWLSS